MVPRKHRVRGPRSMAMPMVHILLHSGLSWITTCPASPQYDTRVSVYQIRSFILSFLVSILKSVWDMYLNKKGRTATGIKVSLQLSMTSQSFSDRAVIVSHPKVFLFAPQCFAFYNAERNPKLPSFQCHAMPFLLCQRVENNQKESIM